MAPGFFGKLRSHGDFVSRRLPPSMQLPFDAWVQAGLVQSRADLGEAWLPTYLRSPLWRFVLAPGVCGPQGWAGLMMPSVDRVGRCFPLTLMASLDGVPSLRECLTVHENWYMQLEDLALTTLDEGFSIDVFDTALQALTYAPTVMVTAGTQPHAGPLASARDSGAFDDTAIDGCSAWWTDGSEQVAPSLALTPGLPAAAGFAAFLDGQWPGHGWQLV